MVHRSTAASRGASVPASLVRSYPLDLTAQSHAPRANDDGREGCGCDLCDAAFDDFDLWQDACDMVFLDVVDVAPMPWEFGWTPDLALVVDETLDPGEVA